MAQIFDGFNELVQQLTEAVKGCDCEHCREALNAGSEIITDEARHKAPVDTGLLSAAGIVFEVNNDGTESGIGWSADGYYGRFLEMGTSKMAARPHLRPAYEAKKDEVNQEMIKKLNLD